MLDIILNHVQILCFKSHNFILLWSYYFRTNLKYETSLPSPFSFETFLLSQGDENFSVISADQIEWQTLVILPLYEYLMNTTKKSRHNSTSIYNRIVKYLLMQDQWLNFLKYMELEAEFHIMVDEREVN